MTVGAARIAVCDYGMGNIRSVSRAAEKAGAQVTIVESAASFDEKNVDGVVLPGQGHFGRCADNLRASGLDSVVRDWCQAGRPFLGICVGMQILAEGSEESAEPGLGLLSGRCRRVGRRGLPVPHMGWDLQTWPSESRLFRRLNPSTRLYYCHSYAVVPETGTSRRDSGRSLIETTGQYGVPFTAAIEKGNLWAVQFHPEKSSADGILLWHNFAELCSQSRIGTEGVVS